MGKIVPNTPNEFLHGRTISCSILYIITFVYQPGFKCSHEVAFDTLRNTFDIILIFPPSAPSIVTELFSVEVEKNPIHVEADYSTRLNVQPVEIVYDEVCTVFNLHNYL